MTFMARQQVHGRPRPVSAAEFESMIRAHEIFVSGRAGGGRTIPRFIVAHDMTCDHRRLMDADFSATDLSRSSFVGADLTRASFHRATLVRCDFRHAILRRSDLRQSLLAGAHMAGAMLDEADMRAAVLGAADGEPNPSGGRARADLHGSALDGAQLDDLVAEGVNFKNCSFRGAKLCNANLRNANFTDANLDGADLTGAQLAGVKLHGAILTAVDLAGLDLDLECLTGCVTDPDAAAYAHAADIRTAVEQAELWVQTGGARGDRGRLDGLDLRVAGARFRNRILAGLSAARVLGVSVDFSGAQLQGAIFDGADLRHANFQGADLRGASFVGAKLAHANLDHADVGPLTLPSGRSLATRFEHASLDGTCLKRTPKPAAAEA